MKRRAAIACLAALIGFGATRPFAFQQGRSDLKPLVTHVFTTSDLDKVVEWTTAVREHRAGSADAAARVVAAWRQADMELVFGAFKCLFDQAVPAAAAADTKFARACGPTFSRERIDGLFGLSDPDNRAGDATVFLHRAVLLHTDIALSLGSTPMRDGPATLVVEDSQDRGTIETSLAWTCARWLLDHVEPDAAHDPMAGAWYRATTALLESRSRLGEAVPNVDEATTLLPADAVLLFDAGALHEAFASARTQNTVAASVIPAGLTIGVGDAASEWSLARQYFARSLALRDTPETRLHLGHVMDGLGRDQEAVGDLSASASSLTDRELQYDAALFLGTAKAALDRRAEAEAAFERASGLYPRAQSPLLGLSQLARAHDDPASAIAALERVAALPAEAAQRDDPWWRYAVSHVRDADALMTALQRTYGHGAGR